MTYVDSNKSTVALIEKKFKLRENQISQQIQQLEQEEQDSSNETEELLNLRELLEVNKTERENELKKHGKKQLTWPASTMNGELRTIDNITAISNEIENNPEILKNDPEFCKGIKGKSLLLNQPFFNLLKDAPCEYMHLVCLEIVRRMIELTFKVGENRTRNTKRPLSDPKLFNDLISSIQLTREFSRRCRNLDFAVMKASEFRNLLLFFSQLFWIV